MNKSPKQKKRNGEGRKKGWKRNGAEAPAKKRKGKMQKIRDGIAKKPKNNSSNQEVDSPRPSAAAGGAIFDMRWRSSSPQRSPGMQVDSPSTHDVPSVDPGQFQEPQHPHEEQHHEATLEQSSEAGCQAEGHSSPFSRALTSAITSVSRFTSGAAVALRQGLKSPWSSPTGVRPRTTMRGQDSSADLRSPAGGPGDVEPPWSDPRPAGDDDNDDDGGGGGIGSARRNLSGTYFSFPAMMAEASNKAGASDDPTMLQSASAASEGAPAVTGGGSHQAGHAASPQDEDCEAVVTEMQNEIDRLKGIVAEITEERDKYKLMCPKGVETIITLRTGGGRGPSPALQEFDPQGDENGRRGDGFIRIFAGDAMPDLSKKAKSLHVPVERLRQEYAWQIQEDLNKAWVLHA